MRAILALLLIALVWSLAVQVRLRKQIHGASIDEQLVTYSMLIGFLVAAENGDRSDLEAVRDRILAGETNALESWMATRTGVLSPAARARVAIGLPAETNSPEAISQP